MKKPVRCDTMRKIWDRLRGMVHFFNGQEINYWTKRHKYTILTKKKTWRNRHNGHIALMAHYLRKIGMYGAVAMGGDGLF